jgi:hypothetical protein
MDAQIIDEPSIRRVEGRGGSVYKAGGEEQHEEDRPHCVKQCTGRSADFASLIYLPSVEQHKYTVPHGDSAVPEIQSLLSFLEILSSKAVGETAFSFPFWFIPFESYTKTTGARVPAWVQLPEAIEVSVEQKESRSKWRSATTSAPLCWFAAATRRVWSRIDENHRR